MSITAILDDKKEERASIIALNEMAAGIGVMLGPFFASYMQAASSNFSLPFAIGGVGSACVILPLALLMGHLKRRNIQYVEQSTVVSSEENSEQMDSFLDRMK